MASDMDTHITHGIAMILFVSRNMTGFATPDSAVLDEFITTQHTAVSIRARGWRL